MRPAPRAADDGPEAPLKENPVQRQSLPRTRPLALLVPLALIMSLAACDRDDVYPVSEEPCAPSDPVQDLDAADCMATPGTISGM